MDITSDYGSLVRGSNPRGRAIKGKFPGKRKCACFRFFFFENRGGVKPARRNEEEYEQKGLNCRSYCIQRELQFRSGVFIVE